MYTIIGNDFEALKHFIIKVYKFLTNKKIILPEYGGRLHEKADANHPNMMYEEPQKEEEGTQ